MPIELSDSQKKLWNETYSKAQAQEHSEERSADIAWEVLRRQKSSSGSGKKSVTQPTTSVEGGTFIDVLMGYGGIDKDATNGHDYLDPKGWEQKPSPLTGDVEHIYADKATGARNDHYEEWQGFVLKANEFEVKEDGLHAKVEVPEHEKKADFLRKWESGELGCSVEYVYGGEESEWQGDNLMNKKTDWKITGFSMTENPSYDTKPK